MDRVRAINDDDAAFERWYGPWMAQTPADVGMLLEGVPATWWIVGGWAIDAFTGRSRVHHDIDVGFFRRDLPAMLEHLAPSVCVWCNASGTLRPLTHPDDLLPDCRQLWVRRDAASPWIVDLAMTPHDGETSGTSPRDEMLRVPIDDAVFEGADGLPYLRPELVLAFKARQRRPQDDTDFSVAWPMLDATARGTLQAAIERIDPGHPWLERVT